MEKKEIDGNTTTEKITTIIDQPKTVGNTSAITVENGTELTIGEVRTVTVNQPQIAGASSAITVENGTVLTSVHDNDNDNMLQECLDVFASYIIVVDQYLKEGAEELADYNGDNWGRELVAECAQGYLGRGGNVSVGRIAGVIGKSIWDLGSGVSAGSITMVSHPLETIENVPAALGDVATTYVDGNWTQKLELTLEIAGIFNGFAKLKRMGKSSATEAGKLAGAEETVGAIDGVVGEAGGIVGSEGVAAVEGAAGEAAEAIEGAAGKGKIRIESVGESGINSIDDIALKHSSVGDFTYNPKTGQISRMKGGGHGQSNIDFLEENGIEYNVVKEYDNGVRVGNVLKHKTPSKRTGTGQAWFPKNWSDSKIKEAGNYVANLPDNKNLPDGVIGYGEYDGVRVGIIKTDGKIGTIFPDADLQP